jgi:hypothetical protein
MLSGNFGSGKTVMPDYIKVNFCFEAWRVDADAAEERHPHNWPARQLADSQFVQLVGHLQRRAGVRLGVAGWRASA